MTRLREMAWSVTADFVLFCCCVFAGASCVSRYITQFTLQKRVAARDHEKFTKTPYFGNSRSFKVIDVDIPKKLYVLHGSIEMW